MKFSVVIPSLNSYPAIQLTIDSLFSACHQEHIQEVIVVDSSDQSPSIEYLEELGRRSAINLIRCPDKTVPGIARNIGARASNSPYLAFVDSDIIVSSQWSKTISDFFSSGGLAGAGSLDVPVHQQNNLLALGQFYFQLNEYLDTSPSCKKPFAPGANLFCTKAIFDKVGGFPGLRASEDTLFGLDVSAITDIHFLPEAKAYHIFREQFLPSLKNQFLQGKYANLYRKYLGYSSIGLKMPYIVLLSPAIMVFKLLRILNRIPFSYARHRLGFIKSSPIIICELFFWTLGFVSGGYEKRCSNPHSRFGRDS